MEGGHQAHGGCDVCSARLLTAFVLLLTLLPLLLTLSLLLL